MQLANSLLAALAVGAAPMLLSWLMDSPHASRGRGPVAEPATWDEAEPWEGSRR